MAIEDNLNELYGLFLANSIMTARMWGYLSELAAMQLNITPEQFLSGQKTQSIQSVDLYVGAQPQAAKIKQRAKEAIADAFDGIIRGKGLHGHMQ